MAYISSSEPIPQNSLIPPPAAKGRRSDARRAANFEASRTGRERLYANIPSVENLSAISLPLAVSARGMLSASELARQTVLNGVGQPEPSEADVLLADLKAIFAHAPQVLSLNGSRAVAPAMANSGSVRQSGGDATVYPSMPDRAPTVSMGQYFNSPSRNKPAGSALPRKALGPPGCGLSGFTPRWGDAYAPTQQAADSGGGVGQWLQSHPWLALAIAGAGVYALANRKGGR